MRSSAFLLVGTAAVAITSPAFAQTAQETTAQAVNPPSGAEAQPTPNLGADIIVTATKRASRVQDVPFSINAQTQQDIQRANAQTIEDISRNVAGLAVQNLGPGQSQVSVRGVSAGQIVRDQPGVKEQVGVYLDESVISLSLFTPDLDLFDLNRVETLRGPQGTLFGSGSVGGTVRYITNQPKIGRTEGQLEVNANTVDESDLGYHVKGAINVPVGDTLAVRAVGYGTHYAGFIDAIGPAAGKNVNDGAREGGRVSLLWEPDPAIKITPRVVYQKVTANGFNREEVFNLYANPFTDPPHVYKKREQYLLMRERFRDSTFLADLVGSFDFGPAELTSVTTRINRHILVSRDASALTHSVSVDIGLPIEVTDIPSNLRDTTELKQFTQEVRLASTGEGPLQWVFGGFYSNIHRTYHQRLPTPGYGFFVDLTFGAGTSAAVSNGFPNLDSPYNADIPYTIKQKAVFGEASYDFGQFKLTAGGRWYDFNETRRFTNGGLFAPGIDETNKTSSNGFSPRLIATYEPNRNFNVNLQVAKGFRLGGVNDPLNVLLCEGNDVDIFGGFQTFKDETNWNYEANMKYSKGPFYFNGAVYHTRMKNLQINLDAGSCSSRVSFNVDKAHSNGIEAEFGARLLEGLDLSFAGSFADAKFDTTLPEPAATLTGIRDGNRLPGVPRIQLAGTATYTAHALSTADWYSTASVQHIGSRYTQAADQENNPRSFAHGLPVFGMTGDEVTVLDLKLPAYTLVNLSTGLSFDNGFDISVYVNNLFDKDPKLSFDRERGGRARLGFNVGQPRTIGITGRYTFGSNVAAPAPAAAPLPPPPPPATQTCADGTVIAATDACPMPAPPPPPPPPPPAPERG